MTMFISRVLPSFLPVSPDWDDYQHIVAPGKAKRLTIDGIDILLQDGTIPFPLHFCQTNVDVDLLFCLRSYYHVEKINLEKLTRQQTLLNVTLYTPEQEWSQNLVQRFNDLLALLLVTICARVVLVEETFHVSIVRKDLRADEVEQREEFLHVVLKRSTGDKQSTSTHERPNNL